MIKYLKKSVQFAVINIWLISMTRENAQIVGGIMAKYIASFLTMIFSNLISLNKAKKLYKENKPMNPDLDDFLEAFEHYGETGFDYQNIGFSLFRYGENGIEFSWGPEPYGTIYFKDKEDFVKNAKIGNEYVRNIWDKIENPCYL